MGFENWVCFLYSVNGIRYWCFIDLGFSGPERDHGRRNVGAGWKVCCSEKSCLDDRLDPSGGCDGTVAEMPL